MRISAHSICKANRCARCALRRFLGLDRGAAFGRIKLQGSRLKLLQTSNSMLDFQRPRPQVVMLYSQPPRGCACPAGTRAENRRRSESESQRNGITLVSLWPHVRGNIARVRKPASPLRLRSGGPAEHGRGPGGGIGRGMRTEKWLVSARERYNYPRRVVSDIASVRLSALSAEGSTGGNPGTAASLNRAVSN